MAQPKTPPQSIRPGDERLARIDAYAAKHAINRHAAMLALIDAGLDGGVAVAPPKPAPATRATPLPPSAKPKPHVSRLKGEWKAP